MLSHKNAKENACGDHHLNYRPFTVANSFFEIKHNTHVLCLNTNQLLAQEINMKQKQGIITRIFGPSYT